MSSDIFKIHVKTRKVVQLTRQERTPKARARTWKSGFCRSTPRKRLFSHLPLLMLLFAAGLVVFVLAVALGLAQGKSTDPGYLAMTCGGTACTSCPGTDYQCVPAPE